MNNTTTIPVTFLFGHQVTDTMPQRALGQFVFDLDTGNLFIDLEGSNPNTTKRIPVKDSLAIHISGNNIITGSIEAHGDGSTVTRLSGQGLTTNGYICMTALVTMDHDPTQIAVWDDGQLKSYPISGLYQTLKLDKLALVCEYNNESLHLKLNNKEIGFNG